MRTKTILIALFVLSIVVLGGVLWRNAAQVREAEAKNAPPTTSILVAARPLATGTLLRAEDVRWEPWRGEVTPGDVVRPSAEEREKKPDADEKALDQVYGAVVRERIAEGSPISSSLIVKPGDRGFLAAVLAPGYRAISIGVTPVSGASGLIFPGDHVDVILTQVFKPNQEPLSRSSVGETIVQDLRVLAVDHDLQKQTPATAAIAGRGVRTVTLEVLPRQAEMINVAAELGKLSLTLRSVPVHPEPLTADVSAAETTHSTWAYDVSPALRPVKRAVRARRSDVIRVMRGGKTQELKE